MQAGLTRIEPQLRIDLGSRHVVVDLADRARRLVVEGDSYTHHGTRDAFRRDCDRYNDLVMAGWTVLRFTWEHVMFQPERVVRTLRAVAARLDAAAA